MTFRLAISVAYCTKRVTSAVKQHGLMLSYATLSYAVFLLPCSKALLVLPCLLYQTAFLIDLLGMLLQQYWSSDKGEYKYVPVTAFADAFQQTAIAQRNMQYLEEPYVAPNPKCDEALITRKYALPGEWCINCVYLTCLSCVCTCLCLSVSVHACCKT